MKTGGVAFQIGKIAAQFSIGGAFRLAGLFILPIITIGFGIYSCINIDSDCHEILKIFEKAFTPMKFKTLLQYVKSFRDAIKYLKDISNRIIEENKEEN